MHFQKIFILLPAAVSAIPLLPTVSVTLAPDDVFCTANTAAVSALQLNPSATAYCSSYLGISTMTITSTSTVTSTAAVTTKVVTAKPVTTVETTTTVTTSSVTDTSTITTTTTTTTTLPPSTLTCLTSAYSAAPQVKRDVPTTTSTTIAPPEVLPTNLASPVLSAACSCLSIPTPSTTTTTTITKAQETITNTSTFTPTVTSTSTVTSTTTVTVTTLTKTSTVTQTATASPAVLVRNGIKYRKYNHKYDASAQYMPSFPASTLRQMNPDRTGTNRDVSFDTQKGVNLQLDDASFNAEYVALIMQGFFVADQSGQYTIKSLKDQVDNWNSLWIGNAAYTWQDGSQAYNASRTYSDTLYAGGSYNFTLSAGNAVPMTFLWANGGYWGASAYRVISPNGTDRGYLSQYLIQPCTGSPFT